MQHHSRLGYSRPEWSLSHVPVIVVQRDKSTEWLSIDQDLGSWARLQRDALPPITADSGMFTLDAQAIDEDVWSWFCLAATNMTLACNSHRSHEDVI